MIRDFAKASYDKVMRSLAGKNAQLQLSGHSGEKVFRAFELEMEHLGGNVCRDIIAKLEQSGETKAASIVRAIWLGSSVA